jgi:hypothetical protein
MTQVIIILSLVLISILWRIFITSNWDRQRIINDANNNGWTIKTIEWEPFGPGFLGEKNDRIYSVRFINENDIAQTRFCKTSVLSGVYWK